MKRKDRFSCSHQNGLFVTDLSFFHPGPSFLTFLFLAVMVLCPNFVIDNYFPSTFSIGVIISVIGFLLAKKMQGKYDNWGIKKELIRSSALDLL